MLIGMSDPQHPEPISGRTDAPFADAPLSQAVFRLARLHKGVAAQLLRDTGLRPGQELVLMTLWESGPQRLVDLVQSLDSDAPTMTRSIARLEKAGLVARSRSAQDGRVVIVQATEKSLPLRPQVDAAWATLEQLTVGAASAARQAQLLQALRELESHLGSADKY
jgi:DNA-binding MarR family transcriptional regulator